MAEMIVVKCDVESKVAMVVCPFCGRISQQILRQVFSNGRNNELLTAHICPVCGTVFYACNSANAVSWKVAFLKYQKNPVSYNDAIKENYANCVATRHGGLDFREKSNLRLLPV